MCILQYPEYYNKIKNPISLNDVKKRWESKDSSYKSLFFVVKDLNRVFSNAMLYYPVSIRTAKGRKFSMVLIVVIVVDIFHKIFSLFSRPIHTTNRPWRLKMICIKC